MFMLKGVKAPICIRCGDSVTGKGVSSGWVTG